MRGHSKPMRQILRDEGGQALALYVIGVAAVLSFVGLAVDVGQVRFQKRQMQAAVDAAALAGAIEAGACSTTDCAAMTTAAKQAVTENGITVATSLTQCSGTASGLTLWVNNGPCFLGSATADPNYGNTSYVEAVLKGPSSMFFGRLVGFNTMNIMVRAEAHSSVKPGSNSAPCLVTGAKDTGATSGTGLDLNGGAINATSCEVYDDWGGSGSLEEANNSSSVTSAGLEVHGSNCNTGSTPCNGSNFGSNSPQFNAPAIPDPLGYLTAPTPGSCTSQSSTPNSGATLQPGTFCSGLNINSGTYTMAAGLYIIEGGTNISGTLNATAGVTIYLYSGQLNLNGGSHLNLTAPSSTANGGITGVAFWQASNDTNEINYDQPMNITGALYAPGALLQMNSTSSVTGCTLVDVGSVTVDSSSALNLGTSCSSVGGSPFEGGSTSASPSTMAE